MADIEKEVNFCYRCGKKVGRVSGKCWYCAAPTIRVVRPPRLCPYCEMKVGPRAVKCPHCGEFLDERARAQQQNVTFVIDKAVIADGRMALPGAGQGPGPRVVQPSGPGGTSGTSFPPLLEGPGGQTLLPAEGGAWSREPSGSAGVERGGAYGPPAGPPGSAYAGQGGGPYAPPQGGGSALAPYGGPGAPSYPLSPYGEQQGGGALAPWAGGQGSSLAPYTGPQQPAQPAQPLAPYVEPAEQESREESRYAVCQVCDTEILKSDKYCFHCGQPQAASHETGGLAPRPAGPTALLHLGAIVLLVFYGVMGNLSQILGTVPAQIDRLKDPRYRFVVAAGALGLIVWAFFRKRRFLSQAFSVIMFLVALAVILAFLP